ncbi:hypothetical protein [Brevundimonas diminuta]|uniref:Uncharacterized protein n=1 Tax=Brevundimonas diminuta TaxID=293 RepID=A0A2X1B808_BREDI|nr:hypothetical protein [Brevundimonas diminuta]SPU46994.1 Uncharacterised protein [Brevundimonas diminuta]
MNLNTRFKADLDDLKDRFNADLDDLKVKMERMIDAEIDDLKKRTDRAFAFCAWMLLAAYIVTLIVRWHP